MRPGRTQGGFSTESGEVSRGSVTCPTAAEEDAGREFALGMVMGGLNECDFHKWQVPSPPWEKRKRNQWL